MNKKQTVADSFVDVRRGGFDFGGEYSPFMLSPEGDEGGGGGGGDDWTPPNLNDPRVKAWYEEQTKPLVTNRDTIKSEKKQLEQQFREFKSKLDPFGGDVDKAAEVLSKLEDEELKSLIKDGKIDDFRNKIASGVDAKYKRTIDDYENKLKGYSEKESNYLNKIKELTIDRTVTELAAKAGVHPTAIEDLLRRARNVFSLDEEYNVVAIDPSTKLPLPSPTGKGNLEPSNWIESLREVAPHLFPSSSGTGTGGGESRNEGGRKVIRLQEGYTQSDYERAKKQAKESGAVVKFPNQK